MKGQWNNRDFEVYLTTYDGAQHLHLHGWLKKHNILIKSESIRGDNHETFGTLTIHTDNIMLEKLKEANYEIGLFCDIEIINMETETWDMSNLDEDSKNKESAFFEKIQDIMFSFGAQNTTPEDIEKYIVKANETSLTLFKQNDSFITDYVDTKEMTKEDKLKDLDMMIKFFEEQERYEDCALLSKIKNKIKLKLN